MLNIFFNNIRKINLHNPFKQVNTVNVDAISTF